MAGLNKVQLIGRLGKDPEVRNLENGAMVATFSIATDETWKDKTTGEKKTLTEWHNIVCWRGLAEIASKYLKKGSQVYIEGKMRTRSWEKDNIKRYTTEVVTDELIMLTPASSNHAPMPSEDPTHTGKTTAETGIIESTKSEPNTDDLPF